jgi:predicted TIM-barrel fold metal-dependent hydrolase
MDYDDFIYFDVHTHFFPKKLSYAIWEYLESHYWPVYLKDTAKNLAIKLVSDFRIKHFLILNYAHKPGIAHSLNEWTNSFCSSLQLKGIAIPFGTIHPGDTGKSEEMDRIFCDFGFAGIKLQLMVTDFYISDRRMKTVYDKIIEYDKVLFVHIGTFPSYTNYFPGLKFQFPYTGVTHLERFMEEYPEMKVIVPHMGADEYEDMWKLIKKYPNLYFDTAGISVKNNSFIDDRMHFINHEQLYEISDRILFGSDFPNIGWGYRNTVLGWLEREMDRPFYEKVFYKNASRFFRGYI